MSFIGSNETSRIHAAGWFLANNEDCTRLTKTIPQSLATTAADGTKFVKMGTIFPSNDANAIGIVYEDVDVTTGNMPGSVVTKGEVYTGRLHTAPESAAKTALEGLGFKFITEGAVTRPDFS